MATALMPEGRQRYFNNDGTVAAGGKLHTYQAGTLVPQAAFTDSAGTIPHQNPIILDAKGEAVIYWQGAYKVDLKAADGTQVTGYPVDNVNSDPGQVFGLPTNLSAGAGSGLVGFNSALVYAANTVGKFLQNLGLGNGSSTVGFILGVTNSVYRSVQDRLRERVSIMDFGAVGDGVTDDLIAINRAIAYAKSINGLLVFPKPSVSFKVSAAPNLGGTNNVTYVGENTTIFCSGTGPVLMMDAGSGAYNDNVNIIGTWKLRGNATSTHGYYSRGHVRSQVGVIEVKNVPSACFRIEFGVLVHYRHLIATNQSGSFTVNPAQGLVLASSGGSRTTACIFDNLTIEAPIADGCFLEGADLNLFLGGAIESVTRGLIIPSGSVRNHFINVDFEGNATVDILDGSQGTQYTNCSASSSGPEAGGGNVVLQATSASTVFDGGYIGKLMQGSTQVGAVQLNSVKFNNNVGLGIQGTAPYRTNGNCQLININFSPVSIPTAVVDSGAFTPGIAGATTPGTQTYSVQKGLYQRIGQIVHFQIQLTITGNSGGAGTAILTGLPLPLNSTASLNVEALFTTCTGVTFTGGRNRLVSKLSVATSFGILIETLNGTNDSPVPIGNIGVGSFTISGTYMTN